MNTRSSGKPAPDRFVNPYTFVRLPAKVVRRTPPGHDGKSNAHEALYSGTICISWSLHAPLLLPRSDDARLWLANGGLRIPGSSMKGVIRSLHEALFAGCARVTDVDFVPGYRDRASTKDSSEGWTLARVHRVDSNDGIVLRLCDRDRVVWVDALALQRAYTDRNRLPATGDTFFLEGNTTEARFGRAGDKEVTRREMRVVRAVTECRPRDQQPVGNRVLLVTDSTVRLTQRKTNSSCYWATGELTDETVPLRPEVVKDFRDAAAGSRDRRDLLRDGHSLDNPADIKVFWPARTHVAWRRPATGNLSVGDVVWARVVENGAESDITQISLAQIWRRPGKGNLGDRIPATVKPCRHARRDETAGTGLCLSCEVFGSADADGDDAGSGRQDSYAGHVRVGAAVTQDTVVPQRVTLAPLGQPQPGAGMFYLDDPGTLDDGLPGQWIELGRPRSLRGRKFYWHHDPAAQAAFWRAELGSRSPSDPRYTALHGKAGSLETAAMLVHPPLRLSQVITVDAITEVGLRSLLCALEPARAFAFLPLLPNGADTDGSPEAYAVHLGGGKPYGLGTATAEITAIDVTTVSARYGASRRTEIDWSIAREHIRQFGDRCGRVTGNWPQLRRVLAIDGLVMGGIDWRVAVSYPPGAEWPSYGTPAFAESYRFFVENNGQQLRNRRKPWRPLPAIPDDPTAEFDPSLPIVRERRRR